MAKDLNVDGLEPSVRKVLESQGIEMTFENCSQLMIFLEALKLYDQRTQHYGELWRQYGALSNLLSMARKVDRTVKVWWTQEEEVLDPNTGKPFPLLHKDALDDAFDLLNYTVFFIRNARAGNIYGRVPTRPQLVRESEEDLRGCS